MWEKRAGTETLRLTEATTYRLGQPLRRASSTVSNPWQTAGLELRMSGNGVGDNLKEHQDQSRAGLRCLPRSMDLILKTVEVFKVMIKFSL